MTQHVQVVHEPDGNPQVRWSPEVGEETVRLLRASNLDENGELMVRKESVELLSRCADPGRQETRTGLVVGYVQSGKTLSFTTVISLARDNGIPLIILLAGTKQNLHEQTSQRLSRDLAVEREGGLSPWALVENPTSASAPDVADNIASMTDPAKPEMFRRATVITVMKNPTRLKRVKELLEALPQYGVDLAQVPVLVVDDEADQAGLNAAVQDDDKDATATYQAIVDLRKVLPRHTYLMYTATPQAPLLINLADVLSPDFVSVLTPGAGYTGGEYFFERHRDRFVRRMSPSEVSDALSAKEEPPASLELALASYYLAVAQRGKGPVSMLVHPSHTQDLHSTYHGFVSALSNQWRQLLTSPGPDRDELVTDAFQPAYADLVAGGAAMRPLDDLLKEVPHWIGATRIRVVNSQAEAQQEIKWNAAPSWILIGGNKLDRGFTVEGLATTYMPRRIGAGQVDSVQQRARFFGYKRAYADLCRAWLNGKTAEVFIHYVEHERMLREKLVEVDEKGMSLKQWKRLMLLDPSFKPTRRAVIDLPYFHDRIAGDRWTSVSKVPAKFFAAGERTPLEELWSKHEGAAEVDDRDKRATSQKHRRALVPMPEVLTAIADWLDRSDLAGMVHPEDVALLNQLTLLLGARLDDDPDLKVELYLMDGGRPRTRTKNKSDSLDLPQGRDDKVYQGDDKFFTDGFTSIQLHRVKVDDQESQQLLGLRVRVPLALAGAVLVQA
jgi:hypothetical protein